MLNLDLESELTACEKAKNKNKKTTTPHFLLKTSKLLEVKHTKLNTLLTRPQLQCHFLWQDLSAVVRVLSERLILQDLAFGNRELQLAPDTSFF